VGGVEGFTNPFELSSLDGKNGNCSAEATAGGGEFNGDGMPSPSISDIFLGTFGTQKALTKFVQKLKNPVFIGAVAGGIAVVVAAPLVLSAVGFAVPGVVGGSIAASVQGAVYGASTTGIFSVLQGAGAAGIPLASKVALGVAGGFAGAGMGKAGKEAATRTL